jgi:hypothetical protein
MVDDLDGANAAQGVLALNFFKGSQCGRDPE